MCKCSHTNCQFYDFLSTQNNKEIFYFSDSSNMDEYCIFHAPLKIKQNFRMVQKELFERLIEHYMVDCILKDKKIDFSDTVFVECNFKDKNFTNTDVDFTNATFVKNVRFENVKCRHLVFTNTKFLDGGAIKNRNGDQNLIIGHLEFRPYSLGSDFVIDIGGYANDEGLIEKNHQGIIKSLRFENHKEGSGTIFFVGLNEHLVNANFKNMILDKVSFQNCDLKNCYFLNSKIDKTEFRNCYFPQNYNRRLLTSIQENRETRAIFTFPILLGGAFLSYIYFENPIIQGLIRNAWSLYPLIIVSSIYIIFFLSSLNIWAELIFSILAKLLNEKGISARSFQVHYAVADELEIYKKLVKLSNQEVNFKIQQNILQETLDSLSSTYAQLKDNFQDKDFQSSGNFFYSQRYTEILASHKKGFIELQMLHIHHLTNGFGEIYMKSLFWFLITLVLFAIPLKPNIDYISTYATPLFFIQDANTSDEKTTRIFLHFLDNNTTKNSFYKSFVLDRNDTNSSGEVLYGYDGRYNYNNNLKEQYILKLDENSVNVSLSKSLSNLLYPFTPEQKKWFQNISPKAVVLSFVESVLLWYFALAFGLALWHRIKR